MRILQWVPVPAGPVWLARLLLSAFAALWLGHGAGAQTAELVMVEQHGCHWCEAWNAEVAAIYPKTAEGRFAPLRRIDLRAPVPTDLSLDGRAVFTPTFILVQDGRELARMEGYGGDELFWWGLSALLAEHTDFKGGEGE